jgi:hypothetical protein
MPLDFGPVQFQIVGTFTEKPRLILNGEEVPYETLHAGYAPAETIEYTDYDGKEVKEEIPEHIALAFSLSSKIGQLEANVYYRVKANVEGSFVLEQAEAEKPDFLKKKDEKKDKKESPKNKKDEEKDGKDKKKGKGTTVRFKIVTDQPKDNNPLFNEILTNLVAE